MVRRDYLQNQIDLLGRVLGKVLADLLGLKNTGEINEGIKVTYQALKEELNIDLEELLKLSNEDFIHEIQTVHKFNSYNLEILAEILFVISEQTFNKKLLENETLSIHLKSIALFQYVEKLENTYSFERNLKIDQLKKRLQILLES